VQKLIRIIPFLLIILLLSWGCNSARKNVSQTPQKKPVIESETTPSPAQPVPESVQEQPPLITETAAINDPEQHPDPIPEIREPEEVLEEAMSAYQEARIAWNQGDLDSAISALDEAYDLILQMELPQDSPLVQEKSDLRLLIAQRIQEIYASRTTAIGGNHKTIPLIENKYVQREIKSFTGPEKKLFQAGYQRSGRYREMILAELRKEDVPEELSWLPMIESWYKVRAYSRARALGLWQFISSTGYRFGLKRDRWIDERMDPEKATQAAAKYLKQLHSMFGDWTTALAAYNCGETRVQRVIKAQRINYLDNFWDLYPMLPRETARFVPRFIATLLIINDPGKYGMTLPDPDPTWVSNTVNINKPIKLASLSTQLGLQADRLAEINPELRHQSTPDSIYQLKIPPEKQEQVTAAVGSLSRWIPPEATYVLHYVRRGETVSGIAHKYRTSIAAIGRLNNLGRRYLIRPGQRIKVPSSRARSYTAASSLTLKKEGNKLIYTVKRGDSLYLIANSFKTTIQKIKTLNNLKNNNLSVGQKLVLQNGIPADATFYTVRSGDTPFKIAQKFDMSLNLLLNINGLNTRSKIYPGQKLLINASK